MPRSKVPLQSQLPYHVGARSINADWFAIPMDEVWRIMCNQLFFIHHAFQVEILAFVLMNNHFHLLIRTPLGNLSSAMGWFMRESSRDLTRAGNRINQAYGGRFHRSLIATNHYLLNAYKYVYANPLKAGIADRAEHYPYSTLPGLLGWNQLLIPVSEDPFLFPDLEGTLDWLNRPVDSSHWDSVRNALRKKEFKLAKLNKLNHPLEVDLL